MESPDEDPSDNSSQSAAVLDGAVGPEELDCAGPYDAERTAGGLLLARLTVRLPHDWAVAEAIASPLDVEWHEPVVRWMLSERLIDEDDHRSYLLRQAILVWSVYTAAPWSEQARKGAAYGLLIVGLESHQFHLRARTSGAGALLLDPPYDFFERLARRGGVSALTQLLEEAFEYAKRRA